MQQLTITIVAMCLTLRPPLRMPICTHGVAEPNSGGPSVYQYNAMRWLVAICLAELNLLYVYAHGMVAAE